MDMSLGKSAVSGRGLEEREQDVPVEPLSGRPAMTSGDDALAATLDEGADSHWSWVLSQLEKEYTESQFRKWLKPLNLLGIRDGVAEIGVPTDFMRDWVESHYAGRLRALLATGPQPVTDIAFRVTRMNGVAAGSPAPEAVGSGRNGAMPAAAGATLPSWESRGTDTGVLDPRYTFDSFVIGKSNTFAHAAAWRIAEAGNVPFNPLFLHGGVGLGKTHLMHAIAWACMQNFPDCKVLYITAEKFMYRFIAALRYKDTMPFKEEMRNVDILLVDDFQFIANKSSTQEEFFHTFNTLIENHKQLVISADRSPTELIGIEPRLVSRLGWGLVADIHPTDYELRLGILQAKAERMDCPGISSEVLDFLARRITSNVRELEGALNRVVAYTQLVGGPVTMEVVREVLSDILRANDRKISLEEIQKTVADYYDLRMNELLSARRSRNIARPRQVAMYLCKQLTQRSLPEIGRKFSNRDHTTVMHAVRKIEDLRHADSTLDEDINRLMRKLQG